MIYNKMIASIVSCNLTSIKWIQSIRSSHINYIITTHYSLTVSFMIAYINVLFIIGIKMTDMNSYVLVCSSFKQGYSLLCNVNQVPQCGVY